MNSCSAYEKMLKNTNHEEQYAYGLQMYEKKKYSKSISMFELLYNTIQYGNKNAESIHYYLAKSHYANKDYLLAGYYFEEYVYKYNNVKDAAARVEECAYLNAMCYYNDSPDNELDQTSTYRAIAQLQSFVDRYPTSSLVKESNERIEELRLKLETKAYRVANQYYAMEYYQAASTAYLTLLKDFPDTKKRSKCSYMAIKSMYIYAQNSVKAKRKERFEEVLKIFSKFASFITDEKDMKDVENYKTKANAELEKIYAAEKNSTSTTPKK